MTIHGTGSRPREKPLGIVAQFTRAAAMRPAAVAVVQDGAVWTYREISAHAAVIYDGLDDAGVRPGQVVAVVADLSVARVAAWLAVLAHHAVLVPIDPATPTARQQKMLEVAGAECVLAIDPVQPPSGHVVIGAPPTATSTTRVLRARSEPGPRKSGYIVFTSGSTGPPKAILGRADSVAHFLHWQRRTFSVSSTDRVAHLASPEFDAALREVFLPLTTGATLCLPEPGPRAANATLAWLADQRITLVHTVPSVALSWLRSAPAIALHDLRAIFLSGEPLPEVLVHRWREHCVYRGEVVNLYGPTETTMVRCWYRVPDPATPGIQPLGRPIDDTDVWVRAPDGTSADVEQIGEIVIRTRYGTNGYLGGSAEDNARFTAVAARPGEIEYRTGDLGHHDRHGLLRYDGREDDQVKVLGIRIHLRAVEALLEGIAGIHQAAVLAEPGEDRAAPRLIAYVVLDSDHPTVPSGVRAHLRQFLPLSAIPTTFTAVDALPTTTASGKLDRRRIAVMHATNNGGERQHLHEKPNQTDHKGQT